MGVDTIHLLSLKPIRCLFMTKELIFSPNLDYLHDKIEFAIQIPYESSPPYPLLSFYSYLGSQFSFDISLLYAFTYSHNEKHLVLSIKSNKVYFCNLDISLRTLNKQAIYSILQIWDDKSL